MVVGTRPWNNGTASEQGGRETKVESCVAAWGLATPDGPGVWTLWTFQPAPDRGEASAALPDIPTPPGCRRTLALRLVSRNATIALEGPQHPETWIEFYEQWFRTHNWRAEGEWRQSENSWHGRYRSPATGGDAAVDLHFRSNGHGGAGGLIVVVAAVSQEDD